MQCRVFKNVCYAVIVALVSTIAPLPLSTPASAQIMPQYSVGVVEFVNESGVQGDLLARFATDAVVIEMSKTSRFDVGSNTRTAIKNAMETLDLHTPLDKVGLVRLGEALSADAMLEGSITSVQLAGSGVTRRASVTLVLRMYDQASGEIVNGAVQTGHSSARVGYTPDDDALIVEAINNAAFLGVKTMVDYVIPEATVQNSLGENQVMLNKGSRDGLKPGMQMIVLRDREIIGYLSVQSVDPTDCTAKVIKSMRGIQSQDKARAIFDMPAVGGAARTQALPSGAPAQSKTKGSTISKIGKFLLVAGVAFGVYSLFKSGRGTEDAPVIGANAGYINWDPSKYGHGTNVLEYEVIRDSFADTAAPVKVIRDPGAIDIGYTSIAGLYGSGSDLTVNYYSLDTNPASTYTSSTATVPIEPYGSTHTYQVRVLYKITTTTSSDSSSSSSSSSTTDSTDTTTTTNYYLTGVSNTITATVIDPVHNSDVISPAYSTSDAPPEVQISDLQDGTVNLEWNRKDGADQYYVVVEPVVAGTGPSWTNLSSPINETGPTVSLSAAQRVALATALNSYPGVIMKWTVYCRHEADSGDGWYKGDENRFEIGGIPPDQPSTY